MKVTELLKIFCELKNFAREALNVLLRRIR